MFKLTAEAAAQINVAANQGGSESMVLRLAAIANTSGSIDYKMGFDESGEEDISFVSEGINVTIAPEYVPILDKVTLDYVTLDDGETQFVFINPNDANFKETAAN